MLRIHGLVKRYGARTALDALELAARQGWFVLVGARDLANEPAFASLHASPRFEALRAIQRGE